tara:strand:- start:1768 stop:3288 length:1521 start_codon:yes stop_codon:yes gene_type:complete
MTTTDDRTVVATDAIGDFFWNAVQRRGGEVFEGAYGKAMDGSGWGEDSVDGVGQDTFQSLFQLIPELRSDLPDHLNPLGQVMSEALAAPEMTALRERTRMNQSATLLAWQTLFPDFLKRLADILDEPQPPGEGDGKGDDEGDDDSDGGGGGSGDDGDGDDDSDDGDGDDDEGDGGGDSGDDDEGDGDDLSEQQKADIRQALAEAADDAGKQVEAFTKAWGSEITDFHDLSIERQLEMAERIARDPEFADIMEMAGNLERVAQARKREKMTDASHERSDIEFGRDLSRMTSIERLRACDPEGKIHPAGALMATDWRARYADSKIQQWKMHGIEEIHRGPLVIAVDTSGSMHGREMVVSKALTVAACKMARKDKRPVRVVLFSYDTETFDSPEDYNSDDYIQFLDSVASRFSGGGTNFDEALTECLPAFERDERYEDADLIFITDGEARVSEDVEEAVNESKERNGWNLYTIYTSGGGCDTLNEISDESWTVSRLNDELCLEVLEQVI